MAAAANIPDIKSAKILHIAELENWTPDERHGNAVRVLGRVKKIDFANELVRIEYCGKHLAVHVAQIADPTFGMDDVGKLFMFLGELQRFDSELVLRARISREMSGMDMHLYDRCLQVRRDFEKALDGESPSLSPTCRNPADGGE